MTAIILLRNGESFDAEDFSGVRLQIPGGDPAMESRVIVALKGGDFRICPCRDAEDAKAYGKRLAEAIALACDVELFQEEGMEGVTLKAFREIRRGDFMEAIGKPGTVDGALVQWVQTMGNFANAPLAVSLGDYRSGEAVVDFAAKGSF